MKTAAGGNKMSAHAKVCQLAGRELNQAKFARICKYRDQYRDRTIRASCALTKHLNTFCLKRLKQNQQLPLPVSVIQESDQEEYMAQKVSTTSCIKRTRRKRGRIRELGATISTNKIRDNEIEQNESGQLQLSFTCASLFNYTMLPINNLKSSFNTHRKFRRPKTSQSYAFICLTIIYLAIVSNFATNMMLFSDCQESLEFGNVAINSNQQYRSKALNQDSATMLKNTEPFSTTTTTTASKSSLDLDDDSFDQSSSRDMKIGSKVNKSLMILDKSPTNDPKVNNMRRLLVRQLANLIMNHEPETIALNMEGARVSGQMVSESGLEISNQHSSNEQVNSETLLDDAGRASVVMESDLTTSSFDNIGNNLNGDIPSTTNNGDQQKLGSNNDNDEQRHRTSNSINDDTNYSDGSSGSSAANNGNGIEEQFVTCPPDYEDQSMIDASNGNLTIEQQQQLLAGADSSGLLSSTNATTNNNNNNQDLTINSTLQQQQQQSISSNRQQTNNQCVHPGNRMIEVITKIITPILFSIIIVVGLVGNIVVMLVILEDRKTERELTPTNLLILDLSLADLSFIIFCIPFTGWDYSVGHWVFGLLWCKFNQYLIVVCALSSIYTLVLMSVDRFMAIVYPIECISYRTSKNTLYAIYIKWIVILLMASPTIQMHGLIDLPLGPDQYTCRFLTDQFNPLHFQIIFFITSYLFPLILIFCLYFSLLNKLWFGSKPHGHKESLKMLESKKKVTWLVAGIVIVFALCWCPIQVMLILMRLKSHKITATYVAIQVFAHTLGYMNSCVNPIVYAFASETFLNSFKKSYLGRICCACSSSNGNINSSTHHQNNDLDRTITGRTTHNNTTSLNHTIISPHHHHHHPHNQQQQLNHMPISFHSNGKDNSNFMSNDNHVSTTTLLMTPYNSTNNSSNDNKTPMSLPLEPRDRSVSPVSIGQPSVAKISPASSKQKSPLIPRQATISSTGGSSINKPAAKQQLVARVAQSGNQVSHICEPCYDQQELAS